MNAIYTRRSVRAFLEKAVEKEKIEKILRAAMQAPSAGNGQPWEFIVVRGEKNLKNLSSYSKYSGCLKNADVAIIVLCNKTRLVFADFWQQDLAAATQNILLQATELGLGSVWFGTAPDEEKMQFIKDLYQLDKDLFPFSIIGIGYPKDENANKFIDRFDESRIHYIG